MRFRDLPAERQSDAGTAGLGGEKGNKQICRIQDPLSFITNDHFDAVARFAPSNLHRSLGFERGVDCIVHEINENLFDLRGVRVDLQLRSGNNLHFQSRLEIYHPLHQLAKIDIFLLRRRKFGQAGVGLHEPTQ